MVDIDIVRLVPKLRLTLWGINGNAVQEALASPLFSKLELLRLGLPFMPQRVSQSLVTSE